MQKIYIYSGSGSYQSKDIELFLSVFNFKYERICEHSLHLLKKVENGIFIVPGGRISDYLPSWKIKGVDIIKNFVERGGIYIGICAGAYVAGKKFKNNYGLKFYKEQIPYIKHQGIIQVKNNKGKIINLIAENGPDLSLIKNGKVLLKDSLDKAQALEIKFKKGKVILFSSHPEGSVYYNEYPQKFSGAIYFSFFLRKL